VFDVESGRSLSDVPSELARARPGRAPVREAADRPGRASAPAPPRTPGWRFRTGFPRAGAVCEIPQGGVLRLRDLP